jgi:hypothetical protein
MGCEAGFTKLKSEKLKADHPGLRPFDRLMAGKLRPPSRRVVRYGRQALLSRVAGRRGVGRLMIRDEGGFLGVGVSPA